MNLYRLTTASAQPLPRGPRSRAQVRRVGEIAGSDADRQTSARQQLSEDAAAHLPAGLQVAVADEPPAIAALLERLAALGPAAGDLLKTGQTHAGLPRVDDAA